MGGRIGDEMAVLAVPMVALAGVDAGGRGMLQPLGHRVLVRPDVQADQSPSGLILPENRDHVPVSGQVVALGPGGSLVKFKARQRAIREVLAILEPWPIYAARGEIAALAAVPDPEHHVAVGDFVVFPADVGFKVTYDGEDYILVNEDDLAVLEMA